MMDSKLMPAPLWTLRARQMDVTSQRRAPGLYRARRLYVGGTSI